MRSEPDRNRAAAVLLSGGLDSAVLSVDLLNEFASVLPIYVRFGLRWEEAELASLRGFLEAASVGRPGMNALTVLDEPIAQIYGDHWSNSGREGVPGFDSGDEAVYLPGRNILLAAKAAVWCRLRNVETLAFGILNGNPFPDSGAEFFQGLEDVLNRGMTGRLKIVRPYERLSKLDVLKRGSGLPLDLTFSCLAPIGAKHCGACNKCAERRRVFREGEVVDPTEYLARSETAAELLTNIH